jgi:hypothetical protein
MILSLTDYHKNRYKTYGGWDEDVQKSARITVAKVSELLSACGVRKPHITHGYMPQAYAKKYGFAVDDPDTKLLMYGQAIGIEDKLGTIGVWSIENVERLVEIGLYMKSLIDTHTADTPFVWYQTVSPKCGSRIY